MASFSILRLGLKLTTILNRDWLGSCAIFRSRLLHGVEHFQAFNYFTEDDMGTVEVWRFHECHEELGAIGVWASVCH